MNALLPCLDHPPHRLSGVVVGALLNDPATLAALGDAAFQPPYKAPPRAPVLEVKPRHTWAGDGAAIGVPADAPGVQVGATLGIVIGRSAHRVAPADALACVAGYLVAGDLHLPLASHYRPAARLKARDGFCPLGRTVVPASAIADPDALALRVLVDGVVAQRAATGPKQRGVARLLADVSEFMTLHPGDLLLLGPAEGAPLVVAGQSVELQIDGIGSLRFTLVAEAAAPGESA